MLDAGNHRLISVATDGLEGLVDHYRRFLAARLRHPWVATRFVLDVLRPKLYVRGEQDGEGSAPQWYAQLSFSGAAGASEVTASLGWHWADLWYRACDTELASTFFVPFGFQPDRAAPAVSGSTFLPTRRYGYASYSPDGWGEADAAVDRPTTHFDIDGGRHESDQGADALLQRLEVGYAALMADGQCRCQLCMPAFDGLVTDD